MNTPSFNESGTEVILDWLGLRVDRSVYSLWKTLIFIYPGNPMKKFQKKGVQDWMLSPIGREAPVTKFSIFSFSTGGEVRSLSPTEKKTIVQQIRKMARAKIPGRKSALWSLRGKLRDYLVCAALFELGAKLRSS